MQSPILELSPEARALPMPSTFLCGLPKVNMVYKPDPRAGLIALRGAYVDPANETISARKLKDCTP